MLQLTANGNGDLGQHAQKRVERVLAPARPPPAKDHFMPGSHVRAAGGKLKAVKVKSYFWHRCTTTKQIMTWPVVGTFFLAVEGAWTGWSGWGSCSTSCGTGTQSRTRSYTNGIPCTGSSSDSQACQGESKCP